MDILAEIFALQDTKYAQFHSGLIPNVPRQTVIGVRVPQLRRLAKRLRGTQEGECFLQELPHHYYEENNLHAYLIAEIRDFDRCIFELERFLPCVDDWATCDGLAPQVLGRHREALLPHIRRWLVSEHPYTVRFALGLLMRWYLDEAFAPEYLDLAASVQSQEYYIRMMLAWFFATALAKQYEAARVWLEEERLPLWVHNKTIQKAVESRRISGEQKAYLRSLRRKTASLSGENLL